MMVSTIKVDDKFKVRVTAKGEAMARTIYANTLKKWKVTIPLLLIDPNWKIPKYKKADVSTHKFYDTLWSDCRSGKVDLGGWRPEAFKAFNGYTRDIIQFRNTDHKAKWKMYKFAKKILRKKHNVTEAKYTGKRMRRTSGADKQGKFCTMVDELSNKMQFCFATLTLIVLTSPRLRGHCGG